ncbi:16S rRNA (guanine(527)-N(7))-methyltransferase RsmG [Oceanivirga miroungae]|uniref:Ribosomal RNA small subunit methyltransferase G n=1 Tax=Oceanivirga miroungae TaxID=1130046 RepID=A0A6I8M7J5_9FUSO|nr:16S rRNA (guanine(527)-N(7))-methyltransferase RsmG [Oceanivirga miroungae]VWL85396.1 methyltransferase GidB [Oceanivirga miroungae]
MENEKLNRYLYLLMEKNKVMNLTAIREKDDIIVKHFMDSMLLNDLLKKEDKNIIDIGTGAGFPGLVLAILNPDKNFLLVDSVKKKVDFLNEVILDLNLKNVKTSDKRAEELIKTNREKFDVALARGVANLRVILEYEIPFLKVGGRFLPQKLNTSEVEESRNALKMLNSHIEKIHEFKLNNTEDRIVIEIVKDKKTSEKYPRKTGIPKKNPL